MKKIYCIMMIIILALTSIPASADNVRTSGLYTYEIKGNGTITITGFNWQDHNGDLFIPAMIDGYTVAGIGENAFKDGAIHNGNERAQYANYDDEVKNPIKVVLPDTIKSIGNQAFFNAGITEINLPDSVQYIGSGAFAACPYLHFIVSQRHPYFAIIDNALYSKANKELLYFPYLYQKNEMLLIPEGIVSVGDYGLYHCFRHADKGGHIKFPSTLRRIGDYAFAFSELRIPDEFLPANLEIIGKGAFSYATISRADLLIPASVTSIGEECFKNMDSVSSDFCKIIIPSDSALTVIPAYAFANTTPNIHLYSSKLERIEDFAFSTNFYEDHYGNLHGVLSPLNTDNKIDYALFESIKYLGISAISNKGECVIAEAIDKTFPAQISTINAHFNFDILIPSSVRTIEANAYDQVVNDFYLPTTLTQISPKAFAQGSTFIVEAGSYAELWALENGFDYSIEGQDNLDWLNN